LATPFHRKQAKRRVFQDDRRHLHQVRASSVFWMHPDSPARVAKDADRLLRPIVAGEVAHEGGGFRIRDVARKAEAMNLTRAVRFFHGRRPPFATMHHPTRGWLVRFSLEALADPGYRRIVRDALRKVRGLPDLTVFAASEALLSGDSLRIAEFANAAAPRTTDAVRRQLQAIDPEMLKRGLQVALDSEVEFSVPLGRRDTVKPREGLDVLLKAIADLHAA